MHATMDGETLLATWERALCAGLPPDDSILDRAPTGAAPPRTLGERNARLASVHARLFGRELELLSHCPGCGTAAQFSGDCEQVAAACPTSVPAAPQVLDCDGHRIEYRLPDAADVTACAVPEDDDERFARRLLERCVLASARAGEPVPPGELPLAVLDALSRRMEALDPAASVSFALACPQCATHWDARLDLGHVVWRKLQAAAERLLLDIDVLARTYGWTERDVLALSPTRRAAYVQMAAS